MECPNCGYVRTADEVVPEWQCPSCSVSYNKISKERLPKSQIESSAEEDIVNDWHIKSLVFSSLLIVFGIYLVVNYGHIRSSSTGNILAIFVMLLGSILFLADLPYTQLLRKSPIVYLPIFLILAVMIPVTTAMYIHNKIEYQLNNFGKTVDGVVIGIRIHIGCAQAKYCTTEQFLTEYRYVHYKYIVKDREYIQADPLPKILIGDVDSLALQSKYKKGAKITVNYSILEPSVSKLLD